MQGSGPILFLVWHGGLVRGLTVPGWMRQPTTLQRFTVEEAQQLHHEQWFQGKHKGEPERYYHFPFGERDLSDGFIQACVPADSIDAVATSEERVERYVPLLKEQGSMGPSWGRFARRSYRRGGGARIFLADGNHRALAAIALGWRCVEVIMPTVDYRDWRAAS